MEPKGDVTCCAGRELHWREKPGTEPAVVLMNGCGLAMEFWRDVVKLLDGVRVLRYDRPGIGGTRWPGHSPRLEEEVASLAALMELRGIRGALLVAHSMAAFHAEALARVRPDLVGGVVLVDGSVEWYSSAPGVPAPTVARRLAKVVDGMRLNHVAGLAFRWGSWFQSHREFSRMSMGRLTQIYRDADSLAMSTAESMSYERQGWDLQELRGRHPWPGVPTLLLTAADASDGQWIDEQARLARLLEARHVVVEQSKHLMMLDRPDAIVGAIHAMRAQAGEFTAPGVQPEAAGPG
ncbi:pimeloyl-ACP methyl ester carboxylesterase [Luteococcus japonicus]|uniref:Pimeloyl-ACP methyl ester carboxylesterase n=1 Tax=Luteococcus japonicus TaxID=33984 RepID=A0A3N1ZRU9_9ACTN|nr:pimeloyl-ACP methyl ester carboxylesterase [Luteococcus japonicus]